MPLVAEREDNLGRPGAEFDRPPSRGSASSVGYRRVPEEPRLSLAPAERPQHQHEEELDRGPPPDKRPGHFAEAQVESLSYAERDHKEPAEVDEPPDGPGDVERGRHPYRLPDLGPQRGRSGDAAGQRRQGAARCAGAAEVAVTAHGLFKARCPSKSVRPLSNCWQAQGVSDQQVARLIEELEVSGDGVSDEAAFALIDIGEAVLPDLIERAPSLNARGQLGAIDVFLELNATSAGPTLIAMLDHEDERVRGWAAGALGDLAIKEAVPHLQALLRRS